MPRLGREPAALPGFEPGAPETQPGAMHVKHLSCGSRAGASTRQRVGTGLPVIWGGLGGPCRGLILAIASLLRLLPGWCSQGQVSSPQLVLVTPAQEQRGGLLHAAEGRMIAEGTGRPGERWGDARVCGEAKGEGPGVSHLLTACLCRGGWTEGAGGRGPPHPLPSPSGTLPGEQPYPSGDSASRAPGASPWRPRLPGCKRRRRDDGMNIRVPGGAGCPLGS